MFSVRWRGPFVLLALPIGSVLVPTGSANCMKTNAITRNTTGRVMCPRLCQQVVRLAPGALNRARRVRGRASWLIPFKKGVTQEVQPVYKPIE